MRASWCLLAVVTGSSGCAGTRCVRLWGRTGCTSRPMAGRSLELRRRWTDGTTHWVFDPVELLERLAALTPRPRVNLALYYGPRRARRGGTASCQRWPRRRERPGRRRRRTTTPPGARGHSMWPVRRDDDAVTPGAGAWNCFGAVGNATDFLSRQLNPRHPRNPRMLPVARRVQCAPRTRSAHEIHFRCSRSHWYISA